jgi:hypothetical protein
VESQLHGFPKPPRNLTGPTKYCFLRYLPSDFDPLCAGCHRVLIDYANIPNLGGATVKGHWAGHMTLGTDTTPLMPFNGHSPNIKNLCSDKFFNPAAGSTCVGAIAGFDLHSHSAEGDTTYYHHYPLEGRYFNGPAYLAGNGKSVPYHWVKGAYFDVDPAGANASPVWYGAGYRGADCTLPDTDQSYGNACEAPLPVGQPLPDLPPLPTLGHQTFSTDLQLSSHGRPPPPPPRPGGGSGGAGSGVTTTSVAQAAAVSLPNTAAPLPMPPAIAVLLANVVATAALRLRLRPPMMRRFRH